MRDSYRATVTLADDTKPIPLVQVEGLDQPAWAEHLVPYGLATKPPVGSPAVVLPVGGEQENLSAIVTGPDLRVPNLAEGELAIGNFLNGTFLKFTAGGNLEFYSLNTLVMRMNTTLTELLLGNALFDHAATVVGNITGNANLSIAGTTSLVGAVTASSSVTAGSIVSSSISSSGGVNLITHRHTQTNGQPTGVPIA